MQLWGMANQKSETQAGILRQNFFLFRETSVLRPFNLLDEAHLHNQRSKVYRLYISTTATPRLVSDWLTGYL